MVRQRRLETSKVHHASTSLKVSNKSYQSPSDFYIYKRPMPPKFPDWLEFAQSRGCELEEFDRMEQDLLPFRKAGGITATMIKQAAALPSTALFKIKDGNVSWTQTSDTDFWSAGEYSNIFKGFAKKLPDMEFVVNLLDEPRVLLGKGSLRERLHTACSDPQIEDMAAMHGFIHTEKNITGELLPVFSQTKINACYKDITAPTWFHNTVTPVPSDEKPTWDEKEPDLFFRGSSTGGWVGDDSPFEEMHRQRLVGASQDQPSMDVAFTGYGQCTETGCRKMREKYGLKEKVPEKENWKHKFIVNIDGNSFSSRLMKTLTSGSVVFRTGLFSEWFDERIKPYVHYIPVRFDLSDLRAKLDWALGHDKSAHVIAEQAALQAESYIRREDVHCYWYRLLVEYASLLVQSDAAH